MPGAEACDIPLLFMFRASTFMRCAREQAASRSKTVGRELFILRYYDTLCLTGNFASNHPKAKQMGPTPTMEPEGASQRRRMRLLLKIFATADEHPTSFARRIA